MSTISAHAWVNTPEGSRAANLKASEAEARSASRFHANNLLRQALVLVRAVCPDATTVRVEVLECDYSDCGEKHPQVTEVRAGNRVLWSGAASGDPHDNDSGLWGDRRSGNSVHQIIAGALSWDPDELAGFRVSSYDSAGEVYELRFEF